MKSIQLLSVDHFSSNLEPVTTTEFFLRHGGFTPNGFFSETIFGGEGTLDRSKTFSYINLNCKIIHPSIFRILHQLDRKIDTFISTENNFSLDKDGQIQIDEDGLTGINEFLNIFSKIQFRGGTPTRDKYIELLHHSYKNNTLIIDKLPIIPPDFRPIYQDENGIWIYDQLNDIYISVLRKALQIETASSKGPLFDLLSYSMQQAVIAHDDFIRAKIGKKSGIIREQLLGKRVDFSGRAVIIPNPDLRNDEIGIPFRMAVNLFHPFIIHRLLYSGKVDQEVLGKEIKSFLNMELSVDSVQQVIKSIKDGDKIPETLYDLFFEETESVMIGRVVLAKRDPVLQVGSYRAFRPVLFRGDTIQLCALVVTPFNADFDGDQMAIFHPLTDKAQEDARTKMMRGVSGETSDSVMFSFSKEMCVGLYLLTKNKMEKNSPLFVSEKDLETATDPYISVVFRDKKTTMGKAIFNNCLPKDFRFIDTPVTKKIANNLIPELLKKYGEGITREASSRIEAVGFKFATIMAPSLGLDVVDLPPEIYKLKEKLTGASTEEGAKLLSQMEKLLEKHLEDTGLAALIESGAAKGWGQTLQILVSKGIIADPDGNILPPIKGSYTDGLTPTEFFNAGSGARKGIIDRVVNTSDTGYVSRKLAYLLNNIEASTTIKDCGVKKYLDIRLDKNVIKRLDGRYIFYQGKVIPFVESEHKIGETIHLRTPIYCRSSKLCHYCYGNLLSRHKTPYVGIFAAQTIGEKGTQLIMQSFHLSQVELKEREVLGDIISGDSLLALNRDELENYIIQKENQVICKKDCKITLSMSNYKQGDNILVNPNEIWVKSLLSRIEFNDLIFNLILDYPVKLQIEDMIESPEEIILNYKEESVFLEIPLEAEEMKQQILYVERLLGGREIFKDVNHLFNRLLKVYSPPTANMDIVHLEVLLSNCLRDKQSPELAARLGKTWDPVMVNIKQAVFNSSFIEGLAFENISKALSTGLVSDAKMEPSILEGVMTGKILNTK